MIFALPLLSIWGLGLLLAFSIIVTIYLETEQPGWATFFTAITVALLFAAFSFNPLTWIVTHPLSTAAIIVAWFLAGTLWGVAKWSFFCADVARRYRLARSEWLKKNNLSELPKLGKPLHGDWFTFKSRQLGRHRGVSIPPKARAHKGLIMTWMIWWPWSAVWTLINDPVKHVFREIYYRIGDLLQKISNSMFSGFDELKEKDEA